MRRGGWVGVAVVSVALGGALPGAARAERVSLRVEVLARSQGPVRPGGLLDYVVKVRNAGESRVPRARVTIRRPHGVSVIGLTQGCRERDGRVVCELGALPPHGHRNVTLWGIVNPDATGRQLLVARAGGARARSVVRVRPGTDLAVRLTVPRRVVAGRRSVLVARVVNRGPRAARSVWLAVGGEWARAESEIGVLRPGEWAERSFPLRVPAKARGTTEVYATTGANLTGDSRPTNNSTITTIHVIHR